jgi:hypothetical protein
MNEQNFDKIFGDKLNEGLDFNFTEQKWGKMEKHLDAFHAEKGRKRLLTWLLLPLLALVGLLTWGGWLLHDAQKHISELTQEVHHLSIEKQISVPPSVISLKSDTVYHHIVVRRYDTIFQTVVQNVVGKFISRSDVSLAGNKFSDYNENEKIEGKKSEKPAAKSDSASTPHFPSLQDLESVSSKQKDSTKTVIVEISKQENLKKTDSLTTNPPLDAVSFITTGRDSIKDKNDEKVVSDAKKAYKTEEKPLENKENVEKSLEKEKRKPLIKPINIEGYELGFIGGLASQYRPNIVQQSGFSVGARGGVYIGNRLKIVGETQYLFLSYEADKITPDLDIKLITPPTLNDTFQSVKVKQPYWQYALGVQYLLSESRLKPYIGINVLGQSKLKEQFEYEYLNAPTNTPVFVQTVRKEKLFQVPFIRFQVGASYPLFSKINAQIEGSYDVKLDNATQFKPLWQVKTGLLYRF